MSNECTSRPSPPAEQGEGELSETELTEVWSALDGLLDDFAVRFAGRHAGYYRRLLQTCLPLLKAHITAQSARLSQLEDEKTRLHAVGCEDMRHLCLDICDGLASEARKLEATYKRMDPACSASNATSAGAYERAAKDIRNIVAPNRLEAASVACPTCTKV